MAKLKKWNPEAKQWETWASNSASGIYSVNPSLFTEFDQEVVSVESALVRDREDINTLQKNVAWLAIHGGNGSGSGGSGSDIINSIEILDSGGNPSSNIAWRSGSKSISYQLSSSKATNRFNIDVTLDGVTISSPSGASPGLKTVSIKNINAYSANEKHTLRITATDNYDNVVTASATITQISMVLGTVTNSYTVNLNELETSLLSLTYQASQAGEYILYWSNDSSIYKNPTSAYGFKELNILNGSTSTLALPYWGEVQSDRLLTTNIVKAGQTLSLYFVLVSKEDPSLKSLMLEIRVTVVSPSELAIQPISLSTDKTIPTNISKASIMSSNFIVYLSSDSIAYNYNITAHKVEWVDPVEEGEEGDWTIVETKQEYVDEGTGEYGNTKVVTYNALPGDNFFVGGCVYRLDIYVEDRLNSSKNNVAYSYVAIQSASNTKIPLNEDNRTIFDFAVWGSNGINRNTWRWTSNISGFAHNNEEKNLITVANMYNMGGKSDVNYAYCRFTNKAYAVINTTNANGSPIAWFPPDANSSPRGLISSGAPQFTLTICFESDFTPDDNRTIFNFGNYIPKSYNNEIASGSGILINNHNFYIKIGSSKLVTGKLQDSIYHELDIVFGRNNTKAVGTTTVEVYHNGVLLAINNEINIADIFTFSNFNNMTLACYKNGDDVSQYTNINVQGVTLYASALNPYQVVCNYINHIVTYRLDNNMLNTTLLNEKLQSNLITANDDGTYTCALWNENANDFNTSTWVNISGTDLSPNPQLLQTCPIPIVILDFNNNSQWTWERFRRSWIGSAQNPAENVPIYFYPPNGENVTGGATVTVEGQGTTSMGYAIKNLDIDFGENRLFWAKQSWFPERIYTLKADVVDSAHANNACIGAFVNTCATNTTLVNQTPPMQYFNSKKSTFDLPATAVDPTDGVSVKHTLEGFPVLLLARFYSAAGNDIRSLGIYSFNLGRKAYYNMGFQVLNKFRSVDGEIAPSNISAPYLLGAPIPAEDIIDFSAQSWEGKDSINCSPKTQASIDAINDASNNGYSTSVNATMPVQLDGYFWSSYTNHINYFWENKYPGSAEVTDGFQGLCRDLVSLPYQKGDVHITDGTVYQYDWNGSSMYVPDQTVGAAAITRLNRDPVFNIVNARFYYVISMLFGLVDSLGKNLNLRIWKNTHIRDLDPIWYTCFYDMDTALGIDNAGAEDVDPDVSDEELYNNPSLVKAFAYGKDFGNDKMFTVHDNKLWGVLDEKTFKDQYGTSGGIGGNASSDNSYYAITWNYIRQNFIPSAESFIDNYFGNQTQNIGELLYNQDFDVKYVNTPQINFMYGDRKAFVKDWITKRIKFLDSFFGYAQTSGGGTENYLTATNIKDCSYKNNIQITHNSGVEYVPIVANAPSILTSTIGGITTNYYYLPANELVNVRVANSGGGATIQTQLNNSDSFLEIEHLTDLSVQAITPQISGYVDTGSASNVHELYSTQFGSLSSFSKFDISGNKSFKNNGIDFIKLFKTWNEGDDTKPYALTELNLSNTKNSGVTSFELNLQSNASGPNGETYYQNPFENLTDINIVNSCVTGVSLPEGVALFNLLLNNSAVTYVNLTGQSILTNVDFTGCTALSSVSLNQCSAYKKLTLNALSSLSSVNVTNCSALEEIYINMNNSRTALTLNVSNVPALKKITVINSYSSSTKLLIDATNLETLILTGNQFTHIALTSACKETLKTFDISGSTIKAINWDSDAIDTRENTLNLVGCSGLYSGTFKANNNTGLEYIQFDNVEGTPFPIRYPFTSCTNLTRVFGNVSINIASTFNNCTKFTIHGGVYNNTPVTANNGITYHLADSAEANALIDTFQTGLCKTNLTFGITSPVSAFCRTNCDAFDVYYALWHIGSATNISSMFQECSNIKMGCSSAGVDNSPHWNMFLKCGNVTNVTDLFYGTSLGRFRIYGTNGTHTGLFSPLEKCTNFGLVFYNNSYIADRTAFQTLSGNKYGADHTEAININYFKPRAIVDDVNSLTGSGVYSIFDNASISTDRGNLTGFFTCINRLSSTVTGLFDGVGYIDYDSFAKLPSGVSTLIGCYNSTNGSGTMNIQTLFNNKAGIENIYHSFRISSGSVTLNISNDTLSGFSSLQKISAISASGTNSGTNWYENCSFTGSGLNKVIISEFPYNLLSSCKNSIREFSGFFWGAYMENGGDPINVPGTLFDGCVNLTNISYCFYNFGSEYKLTSNGFNSCRSLANVSYLFGASTSGSSPSKLIGSIPNNLFNIGFSDTYGTYQGATVNNPTPINIPQEATVTITPQKVTAVIETLSTRTTTVYSNVLCDDHLVTYTPLSTYVRTIEDYITNNDESSWVVRSTESGYVGTTQDFGLTETSWHKHIPNAKISNIEGCFQACNVSAYMHDEISIDDDVEDNPSYCPYDYLYNPSNGKWSTAARDNHPKTYMWVYDGQTRLEDLNNEYYLPDANVVDAQNSVYREGADGTASVNFCTAPDLLRWCTTNANVKYLFRYSGHPVLNTSPAISGRTSGAYGIKGRIPSYLLKPVKDTTSISGMFQCCDMLSGYRTVEDGDVWMIPEQFFSFSNPTALTDLSYAFSGMHFLSGSTLTNIAGALKGSLNVSYIFKSCYWSGGTSANKFAISNVFAQNKVSNATAAFAIGESIPATSFTDGYQRSQYITFNNVFSTNTSMHPQTNDWYVFWGWDSNYVTHESRPTVSTAATRYNYWYYNE